MFKEIQIYFEKKKNSKNVVITCIFAHAYSHVHKHTAKKLCLKKEKHHIVIVIWGSSNRKKKFSECGSTLNLKISFKLKVKSSAETLT